MFGLQKQRRNAADGGAWFIAGHLTVFAKLSHHAVPLESRIFSSRCFSFSVPPLSPPPLPPSLPIPLVSSYPLLQGLQTLAHLSSLLRYYPTKVAYFRRSLSSRSFAANSQLRSGSERISNFRNRESTNLGARPRDVARICFAHLVLYFSHNFCMREI